MNVRAPLTPNVEIGTPNVEIGTSAPIDRVTEIERLAALEPIEYDITRTQAAKK